jgi:hypothetical protein
MRMRIPALSAIIGCKCAIPMTMMSSSIDWQSKETTRQWQ